MGHGVASRSMGKNFRILYPGIRSVAILFLPPIIFNHQNIIITEPHIPS
jgi:hypothetical protein